MKRKINIILIIISLIFVIVCGITINSAFIKENKIENEEKLRSAHGYIELTGLTFSQCESGCCENVVLKIEEDYGDGYTYDVATVSRTDESHVIYVGSGGSTYNFYEYNLVTEKKELIKSEVVDFMLFDDQVESVELNYEIDSSLVCPVGNIQYNISKEWKDDNSADRPTEIEFGLYTNDGTIEGESCTANAETNWNCTIEQEYYKTIPENIRIYENTNDNYEISDYYICDNCQTGNRTITNEDLTTSEVESSYIEIDNTTLNETTPGNVKFTNLLYDETDIIISKEWTDKSNEYNTRPESISIKLKQNGNDYQTYTLTGTTDTWSTEILTVPVYDKNGALIEYTIEEEKIEYYDKVDYYTNGTAINARRLPSPDEYLVVNTLSHNEDITITKKWLDGNNINNVRPSSVEIVVYQNNTEYQTITLNGNTDTWTKVLSVPKYDDNQEEYTYTIKEKTFTLSNEEYSYASVVDGLTITNTLNKKLTIKKRWQDNSNAYSTRPPNITIALLQNNNDYRELNLEGSSNEWSTTTTVPLYDSSNQKYNYSLKEISTNNYKTLYDNTNLTITNTLYEEKNIEITKNWIDNANKYETRPSSIEVTIKQNGENYDTLTLTGSTDTWKSESITVPVYDNNGVKYSYTLKEDKVQYYNDVEYDHSNLTITNTLSHNEDITITKKWLDGNNINNVRPSSVEIVVYQNDIEYQTITLNGNTDTWSKVLSVPKYDDNQNEYKYTLKELTIPKNNEYSYTSSVDNLTITNTLNKEITINKIWVDNNNSYSTRPTEIKVNLLQNNNEYEQLELKGQSNENNWTVETIIPLYDKNNHQYNYSLQEEVNDNYKVSYDNEKYSITNTLNSSKYITIKKEWNDNSNKYNTRPNNITIKLLQNNNELQSIVLSGDTDIWTSEAIEVPVYDINGVVYNYTIKEDNIDSYGLVSYDQDNLKVTNTLKENINITITKKWIDSNNSYNTRPTELSITLLRNGEEYQEVSLSGDTDIWSTIIEVPKFDENQELYKYSIREITDNLNSDYSEITYSEDGLSVTNKLNKNTSIKVKKIWNDEDNKYKTRPSNLELVLLQNNKEYKTFNMDYEEDNTWEYLIENIPVYDSNGSIYTYTIAEAKINDFYGKITYDQTTYTITNELTDIPKVKLYFNVTNGYTELNDDEIKFDKNGLAAVLKQYNLKYGEEYTYQLYLENIDTGEKFEGKLSTNGTLEFDNLPYGTYRAIIGKDEYFEFVNMSNIEDIPGVTYQEDEQGGIIIIEPNGKDIIYGVKVLNKITMPIENPNTNSNIIIRMIILFVISLVCLCTLLLTKKKCYI